MEYLSQKSKSVFAFGSNVNLQLTFQKFDPAWECFVDLEEDYEANHKDKLKVVVTPLLKNSTEASDAPNTTDSEVCICVAYTRSAVASYRYILRAFCIVRISCVDSIVYVCINSHIECIVTGHSPPFML